MKYVLAIDQSTSCTKAMLFDEKCRMTSKESIDHRQIINEKGWVEHDGNEIYSNMISVVRNLITSTGINPHDIVAAGLSTQRETTIAWDKISGSQYYNAIVWHCSRAADICKRLKYYRDDIQLKTGTRLSPYFSAAKMTWLLENVAAINTKNVILSNIDAFLIFRLSGNKVIKTDYSNACRTQLYNIKTLDYDSELLDAFGIRRNMLSNVCESNELFCMTNFDGVLPNTIPLHAAMGDSQSALYAQGCIESGLVKATYGTGSSIMMNTGSRIFNSENLSTSIAWMMNGKINYVLEGNVNYSGATIRWLVDDVKLLQSSAEAGKIARQAKMPNGFYLIPAFTGLGAPFWDQNARAMIVGMDRTIGKAEIVRAAEESIAYQITDVLEAIKTETNMKIDFLKTDGGATRDSFLMQFQSDIANIPIMVADVTELSGKGVAIAAGCAVGLYDESTIFKNSNTKKYIPEMNESERDKKRSGWKKAIAAARAYIPG